MDFASALSALKARGYTDANVEEKLAQDVLLEALSRSALRDRATLKGGVVMANLTRDVRRTTMDVDLDFVRRGIDDASIRALVDALDVIEGVRISLVGDIVELRQQDYRGKRVHLSMQDAAGTTLQAKLDIGVHVHAAVEQAETPFDVRPVSDKPAVLLANPPEQVFVEKLKSLLRLGPISNRGKDVFDMAYLAPRLDKGKVRALLRLFVYDDARMMERDAAAVLSRVRRVFADRNYRARLAHRRSNWMQTDPAHAMSGILAFLETL